VHRLYAGDWDFPALLDQLGAELRGSGIRSAQGSPSTISWAAERTVKSPGAT
jgi:hypothetical protein